MRFRSLDGVETSGCFSGCSTSTLSGLAIANAAFDGGATLDVPTAGAISSDAGGGLGTDGDWPLGARGFAETPIGGGDDGPEFFCIRPGGSPGDFLEGTVLLR